MALNSHVVTHSELGDCVSKPGVSDELPPDYSWTKSHRGGPPTPDGDAQDAGLTPILTIPGHERGC